MKFSKTVIASALLTFSAQVCFAVPVVVGYDYSIVGAEFERVQAPSFATIADLDGYQISAGGVSFSIASSQIVTFADFGLTGINAFSLTGIDESLAIDPNDPSGFPIGVSLLNINNGTPSLTSDPITFDPDVAIVPLPAGLPLLLTSLGGFMLMRKRRQSVS